MCLEAGTEMRAKRAKRAFLVLAICSPIRDEKCRKGVKKVSINW